MHLSTALAALGAALVAAVPPLEIQGKHFVNPENGEKFQIVGMAYQPGGSAGYNAATGEDPLTDPDVCLRDAALMQALGINAIRVYNLNPNGNHDECASIFNAAGMYMMLDVNAPGIAEAISPHNPWETYYDTYLNRTFAIVEAFANYPNTLLFYSANEVIDDEQSVEQVPPYIRAVIRDLKTYIRNNIDRQIPVGYSAADVRQVLWDSYNYIECEIEDEEDNLSRGDFFALNSYSWCGIEATFETSSFDDLVEGFKDSPVPIFFSEYGCNELPERWWNETQSIYGSDMNEVFSGGIVYEWTQERNDYGLVNITDDGTYLLDDYVRLRDQFALIDWETLYATEAPEEDVEFETCRSSLIETDGFMTNFTVPRLPPNVREMLDDGIDNKPSGRLVDISNWATTLDVFDAQGNAIEDLEVVALDSEEFNWYGKNRVSTGGTGDGSGGNGNSNNDSDDDDDEGAAVMAFPALWAAALPLLAMIFA